MTTTMTGWKPAEYTSTWPPEMIMAVANVGISDAVWHALYDLASDLYTDLQPADDLEEIYTNFADHAAAELQDFCRGIAQQCQDLCRRRYDLARNLPKKEAAQWLISNGYSLPEDLTKQDKGERNERSGRPLPEGPR